MIVIKNFPIKMAILTGNLKEGLGDTPIQGEESV
jgi:hypothetical protein